MTLPETRIPLNQVPKAKMVDWSYEPVGPFWVTMIRREPDTSGGFTFEEAMDMFMMFALPPGKLGAVLDGRGAVVVSYTQGLGPDGLDWNGVERGFLYLEQSGLMHPLWLLEWEMSARKLSTHLFGNG